MKLVPLFPLQLVLFPGEYLPLHIFEPRYKEMINYCLETGESFGLVSYINNKVSRVGCLAPIEKVNKKYDDGRYDITCRGADRFMIQAFNSTRPYLQGSITPFHDSDEEIGEASGFLESILPKYRRILSLVSMSGFTDVEEQPRNSFEIARVAGFDLAQKQNLLEIKTEEERLRFINEYFDVLLPRMEKFDEIRKVVRTNGHFKHFPPLDFNVD